MPTKEQLARWQHDWGVVVAACGKKIDSFKIEESGGKERLTIVLHDGMRIGVEASGNTIRTWVRRCGQPGDGPGECKP